jgi:hypothetical protein
LFRVSRFAPAEPLDASPSSPRPRNTRSSRNFYVPITPHSRPPDHLVDGRENRSSRARRSSRSRKTKKKRKTKKNEITDRVRENPTCLPMPSSSRTAIGASGASTRRPADMLGGGAAAEKTKGYL